MSTKGSSILSSSSTTDHRKTSDPSKLEKLSRRASISILRWQSKDDSKIENTSKSDILPSPTLSTSLPAQCAPHSPSSHSTSPNKRRESSHSYKSGSKTAAELALSPRATPIEEEDEDWVEDPANEELRREATRLLVSDMRLIGALGDAVANDENSAALDLTIITDSLLDLFAAEKQTLRLLEAAISREILRQMKTDEFNTLFRSNNLSCKLLSSFFRSECRNYLKEKVGKLVKDAVLQPNSYFEIDKARIHNDAAVYQQNLGHLRTVCDNILNSLCKDSQDFPLSVRRLCWFLRSEICFHFPGTSPPAVNVILSGMVFLRLFCPAILTPTAYGILDEYSPEASRTLLLISKVLLAAANGAQFGASESGLSPLNDFVKDKKDLIDEFLRQQSNIPQEDVMISPSQFEAKHFRKDKIDFTMSDWIGNERLKSKGRSNSLDILLKYFLQYKDTVLYYIEQEAVDKTKRSVATQSFNNFMEHISKIQLRSVR